MLRRHPEDFEVEEELAFRPADAGPYVYLRITKRNSNTAWVARQIAVLAGVPVTAVGYAGLKDRRAATSQWFSVSPGKTDAPDWGALTGPDIRVTEVTRHHVPLKRGDLARNRFRILIRDLSGDPRGFSHLLDRIGDSGVPNYFGPQRFGHGGRNVARASQMFDGEAPPRDRERRGLYLSAARGFVFNQVLAARVDGETWNRAIPGEALLLPGSGGIVAVDTVSETVQRRVGAGELEPTGPLWGRGELASRGPAAVLEREAAVNSGNLAGGLERAGLRQARRLLRLSVSEFNWESSGATTLSLAFTLPPGSYATAVLRELIRSRESMDGA